MTPSIPNRGPSWLLAVWAFLLGGCASMGTLQTADTLGAGKNRWSLQFQLGVALMLD